MNTALYNKKRIILCAPPNVREFFRENRQFAFIPYGKLDPSILDDDKIGDAHGIVVYFSSSDPAALQFFNHARAFKPALPCFILCQEDDQAALAEHGWHLIPINDRTTSMEVEDKVARGLFLFPYVQRAGLRRILGMLKRIPSEAANHQRIMRRLQDPQFQLEDVARIIKQDLALTAQVLKIANSAAFIRERPVQDVNIAVAMVGATRLKALVSCAWAFFLMNDTVCPGFYPAKEWDHANRIADTVAKRFEARQDSPAANATAFISAILHDIGKLLLAANLSAAYSGVLSAALVKEGGVCEAENEILGFNHAEVGGCLLALWGLPLAVAEAVVNSHTKNQPEDSLAALIQRAHLEAPKPPSAAGEAQWID